MGTANEYVAFKQKLFCIVAHKMLSRKELYSIAKRLKEAKKEGKNTEDVQKNL